VRIPQIFGYRLNADEKLVYLFLSTYCTTSNVYAVVSEVRAKLLDDDFVIVSGKITQRIKSKLSVLLFDDICTAKGYLVTE
jgi:hypothetical protein